MNIQIRIRGLIRCMFIPVIVGPILFAFILFFVLVEMKTWLYDGKTNWSSDDANYFYEHFARPFKMLIMGRE